IDERGAEVRYAAAGHSSTKWCFGGQPDVVRHLCARDWRGVMARAPAGAPPFALGWPLAGRAGPDATRLARAQGCLLGQFAGDSLGGLVEFSEPQEISQRYPDGCRELHDGGTWGNLAGQPTDDSEMALMLARTLVHEGRYDRGSVLNSYLHWWPR